MKRIKYFLGGILMVLGGCFSAQAQVDGAAFEEFYYQGVRAYNKGDFAAAGDAFARAYEAYPGQSAALMAARSYAIAKDTASTLALIRTAIDEGRFVFDHPEFLPYAQHPKFKSLIAEANVRLEYMRTEVPEPRFLFPYDYEASKSYPLVVYLPGHGSGRDMFEPGYLELCNRQQFIWMVVRGGKILGENSFTWQASEAELNRIALDIEKAKSQFNIEPDKIFVFGYDVGGTAGWEFQRTHPGILKGIGHTAFEMPDPAVLEATQTQDVKVFVIPSSITEEAYLSALENNQKVFEKMGMELRYHTDKPFFEALNEMISWFIGN